MDAFSVYKDIQARTKGQILVGVVGPVRTGKSTFIRRFMELVALPAMEEQMRAEVQDRTSCPVQERQLLQWNLNLFRRKRWICCWEKRFQ